jgi:hypothetical protein
MRESNGHLVVVSICALVVVLGLVLFSAGASRFPRSLAQKNDSMQGKPQKDLVETRQEIDARVPSTDFDAPETGHPEEKAKRWKKNKHYDKGNWVSRNPSDEGTATVIDSHAFFALPALPVAQSDVILTARILNAEAHLSNDKTGVYSEFKARVSEVFKGAIPTLSRTDLVTISRRGGKVRYPSGHVERYEIMNQFMPAIGKRYLFFLKAIPDSDDYEIITGYEVGLERVHPLDTGQFEIFRGKDVVEFLNTVRDAIIKTSR